MSLSWWDKDICSRKNKSDSTVTVETVVCYGSEVWVQKCMPKKENSDIEMRFMYGKQMTGNLASHFSV